MSALASGCTLPFIFPLRPESDQVLVFFIHLDQHEIYVIETDGVEVQPYLLDTLTISIGQRYSILVQAKNSTSENFAMMVSQSPDMSVI